MFSAALRVPYTQYGFYLYLHVSEGVPVRKKDEILDTSALSGGKCSQRQLWEPGEWEKDFPQNSFLYDRILGRPPVLDRYSAKKMP